MTGESCLEGRVHSREGSRPTRHESHLLGGLMQQHAFTAGDHAAAVRPRDREGRRPRVVDDVEKCTERRDGASGAGRPVMSRTCSAA